MVCPKCGKELGEAEKVCDSCGTMMIEEEGAKEPVKKKSNTFSLLGLIFSIIGWFISPLVFGVLGIVMGIFGIKEAKEMDGQGKGMGIAAIIVSVVSIVVLLIMYVLLIVFYVVYFSVLYGTMVAIA